jgi:O-antigen/teichoic acid export membrane protein
VQLIPLRLRNSEFFRNVFTLTAGTFLAQLVTVLLTPVLSRLYTPADYAVFALFTSFVSQVAVGASLRLEMALPTVQDDREADGLTRLAFRIVSVVSLLSMIALVVWLRFIGSTGGSSWVLLLAPLGILFTALMQVLNMASSRAKTFRLNSMARIVLSLVTGTVSMLLGWMGWGANGLIFGMLGGLLAGTWVLWHPQRKNVHSAVKGPYPDRHYFRKFRQYVFVNTPHALVDTLEVSGILFLMNRCYTQAEIGSYFFAYRLLKLPVALIGAAVFQVFYQRMAEARSEGRPLAPMIRSVYRQMALVGLPVFLVLMFFSDDVFPFVFGKEWKLAGMLASVMSPWLFFNFLASAVSSVGLLLNFQKQAFAIAIVDISFRMGFLLIGGGLFGFSAMVSYLAAFSSLVMVFATWWYHHIARKNDLAEATV